MACSNFAVGSIERRMGSRETFGIVVASLIVLELLLNRWLRFVSLLASTMHRSSQGTCSILASTTESPLVFPISPPPPSRRPSKSTTMPWLSPYTPSKAVKIPEPKRVRTIDILTPPRSGTLGTGAIVVRTPEEALRETGVRLSPEYGKIRTSATAEKKEERNSSSAPRQSSVIEPISPTSPPLPPLPLPETDEDTLFEPESPASKTPPRPVRAPPPPPISQISQIHSPSRRSSMKSHSRAISTADDAPTVPPLPAHIVASSQPPPFHAILVSELPSMIMDTSKMIVTLETCTATYRTTLSTINSRPSQLSKFLSSVLTLSDHRSARSSAYSTESDDLAMYRRHLTSQGLLPHSSNIHLFLDRPSAP